MIGGVAGVNRHGKSKDYMDMLNMGKEVTVKKDGNSLKITFPAQIAEMYNIGVGSRLEMDPMGSDSFRVRVVT